MLPGRSDDRVQNLRVLANFTLHVSWTAGRKLVSMGMELNIDPLFGKFGDLLVVDQTEETGRGHSRGIASEDVRNPVRQVLPTRGIELRVAVFQDT